MKSFSFFIPFFALFALLGNSFAQNEEDLVAKRPILPQSVSDFNEGLAKRSLATSQTIMLPNDVCAAFCKVPPFGISPFICLVNCLSFNSVQLLTLQKFYFPELTPTSLRTNSPTLSPNVPTKSPTTRPTISPSQILCCQNYCNSEAGKRTFPVNILDQCQTSCSSNPMNPSFQWLAGKAGIGGWKQFTGNSGCK